MKSSTPLAGTPLRLLLQAALILSGAWNGFAGSVILVEDGFDDGGRTNGTDPYDVAWFTRFANPALTIVTDNGSPGIGGGNALNVNATGANQPIVGVMTNPVTLAVSDTLEFSFDFRLTALVNSGSAFRFGIFDSNGTSATADNQTVSDNDRGYRVVLGAGGTAGLSLSEENGTNAQILTGSDGTNLTDPGAVTVNIADNEKYNAYFTITRSSASQVDLYVAIRNSSGVIIGSATGTDTTSPYFSFDEIAFNHTTTGAVDYRIDNISLTIPEPTTALFSLFGFLLFLHRNRIR